MRCSGEESRSGLGRALLQHFLSGFEAELGREGASGRDALQYLLLVYRLCSLSIVSGGYRLAADDFFVRVGARLNALALTQHLFHVSISLP